MVDKSTPLKSTSLYCLSWLLNVSVIKQTFVLDIILAPSLIHLVKNEPKLKLKRNGCLTTNGMVTEQIQQTKRIAGTIPSEVSLNPSWYTFIGSDGRIVTLMRLHRSHRSAEISSIDKSINMKRITWESGIVKVYALEPKNLIALVTTLSERATPLNVKYRIVILRCIIN